MNAAARRVAVAPGALAERRILYCVGAQRAGTSWLDAMFRSHPQLHAPVLKEVHYWDTIRPPHSGWYRRKAEPDLAWYLRASLLERVRRYPLRLVMRGEAVRRLLEARVALYGEPSQDHAAYAALLLEGSRPEQVVVDNTPAYALLGADTFAEMDALGDARFVFVMRDPVERLWSGIRHRLDAQLAAGEVTPRALTARFAASVEDDDDRDVARCEYRRTIAALENSVDPRRVLYLFHETLFDQVAYDRLTSFLGVDRRGARPGRRVNRGPEVVRPDAAMRARARERLAPVYEFVRERFGAAVPTTWMQ